MYERIPNQLKFRTKALVVLLAVASSPSLRSHAQSPAAQADFRSGVEALRGNHIEEAITLFNKVTQESPRFAEAYLNLGLALSQAGRNAEAVTALKQATLTRPTLRGAHLFLAISQYRMGLFPDAAASIRKETALSASDPKAWMWQGVIDLASAHLAEAVDALNHAAKLDPNDLDILYHRGRASLDLSRQSYEQMFRIDPNSWHVHQVLAQAAVEADKDADAVEQYRRAIASAPPQSGLHEALATALWRLGKFDDAEAEFNTALGIDPGDTLAMYKLGCLQVDRSKASEGKPLLEKVALADPSLKLVDYYLGRAEMQLGNEAGAVVHFKKSISLDVDEETIRQSYFQLSRAYRRLHQTADANLAQEKYRQLHQEDRQSRQDRLEKIRTRYDRDTQLPPAPSDAPLNDSQTEP